MTFEVSVINSKEYVTIFLDDDSARTFPVDLANPDYAQFLASQTIN